LAPLTDGIPKLSAAFQDKKQKIPTLKVSWADADQQVAASVVAATTLRNTSLSFIFGIALCLLL
jgi:hypothetical protein